MIIKPKNWVDFQHYKDRCPPWIKLHKSILDNYEFHKLPDASKALAMCLWLVASEHLEGEIDADYEKLAFRFRSTQDKIEKALNPLIVGEFFNVLHGDSKPLAERKQDAPLEETETYKPVEAEKRAQAFILPDWIDRTQWDLWLKTRKGKKMSPEQMQANINKLDRWRSAGLDHCSALADAAAGGWQGLHEPNNGKSQPKPAKFDAAESIYQKMNGGPNERIIDIN